MQISEMKILVIGDNGNWAKADTLDEAIRLAYKPKQYVAYIAHPESSVDKWGLVTWPRSEQADPNQSDRTHAPKMIVRKMSAKAVR